MGYSLGHFYILLKSCNKKSSLSAACKITFIPHQSLSFYIALR